MPITRISVDNPVFATMMMVALMVLGLFAYKQLGIDQFPSVDFPVVLVEVTYPGASPESVEDEVTRPIEEAVNTIAGIKNLTSISYEGRSLVVLEFELTTQSAVAVQDVREKVASVQPRFRDEVKSPAISRFNPDDQAIVSIAVRSTVRPLRELTVLADKVIRRRLENARGVGRATIVGGSQRQINIEIDPDRLQALGIGIDEVMRAVREENQDVPAGTVTRGNGDRTVQVVGKLAKPSDFLSLIVARRGNAPVYLRDVASATDGQKERDSGALVNGVPGLAIDLVKVQGSNTIEVAAEIRDAIADLRATLPPDVELVLVRDASRGIRSSVDNVQETLVEGGMLTVAIVFLFLGSWRSTVITGLALPISVLGSFLALLAAGFTLNVMTLMALSLAIGILIDDAIVVRENITRHLAMGKSHRQAALDGTKEIGLAVLATTLSIVAVFLPVAFMGGIIGRFFLQFGLTVVAAVLISLFVSFTLDPMLSSIWYDPAAHGRRPRGPVGWLLAGFDRVFAGVSRAYLSMLRWGLRHRRLTLAAALASFIGSFFLVPLIGTEFVPASDLGEQVITIETPVGSSLEYTEAKLRQVDLALREFPEVDYTYASINSGLGVSGKNKGQVYVRLKDISQRKRSPKQLAAPMRQRLAAIAGVNAAIVIPGPGGAEKSIQVSLQGRDLAELDRISREITARMAKVPGFVDIDTSLKAAKPILAVRLDRALASDLGISTQQVAATLSPLFAGDATSTWKAPDGETYDVEVRLPASARAGKADLDRIYIAGSRTDAKGAPQLVPLSQVAEIRSELGASQINRRDLQREVLISANDQGRSQGELAAELKRIVDATKVPPGYRFIFKGATKDMQEAFGFAVSALGLAVVLIYLILASQFGSFLQPLAIMASLPLSLVGVLLGLLFAGSTLNVFSVIGFIMLMGLVTKNAILMVDFVNQHRREGHALDLSIMEAAEVRLRPIMMTTLAMILGMAPLALGLGEGAEQRAPMAHAVIGGLISSTLLTLLVVPVLLTYIERLQRWGARTFPRRAPDAERAPAE